MSIASDLRAGMNDCCGMNSGSVAQRLMEEFEGTGEGLVGILDAQRGGWEWRESFRRRSRLRLW